MHTSQSAQQSARLENSSRRVGRSHSISSDRPSTASTSTGLLSPPLSISPEPVYIASSAASQIVTNDHDSTADAWLDQHGIEPSGETALVSPAALKLVNTFLDQLVLNFLSASKSTSLVSLRPAITEVLKPRLARDAVRGADSELREYLGGSGNDELLSSEREGQSSRDWDLELVWKRTRLRCMVYSSLGDMEEEDEDRYTAQEHLNGSLESGDRENETGIVSPAVAIFLTSILEFMGEQILIVAGQAAYTRLRMKYEKEERDGTIRQTDIAERVVVEDTDMERVGSDRILGKLWRDWKKRARSPTNSESMSHSHSREITGNSARPVLEPAQAASISSSDNGELQETSFDALAEHKQAAMIPLPMTVDDVREIEIPGLAPQSDNAEDDDASETEELPFSRRPKSMVIFTNASHNLPTPSSSQPPTPIFAASPSKSRKRANSLPPPIPSTVTSLFSRSSEEAVPRREDSMKPSQGGAAALNGTITPAESEKDAGEEDEEVSSKGKSAVLESKHEPVDDTTEFDDTSKDMDSDFEFVEEPQIMTSSRISFGGRVSPDDRDSSTRSSVHSSAQSPSIHSLRLIDVNTAKSPTTRSRQDSFDATDFIPGRGVSISRPTSIHSPIITELSSRGTSPHFRSSNSSPLARTGSNLSSMPVKTTTDSISEVDERESAGDDSPLTAVPSELAAAMQGVDVDPSPTSQNYPSFKSAAFRSTPFVLAAPPTPQNYRENMKGSARQQANKGQPLNGFSNSNVRGIEQDVQMTYQGAKNSFEPPPRSVSRTVASSANENPAILPVVKESSSPEMFKSIPRSSLVRRTSSPRSMGEEVSRKAILETQHKVHQASYTSSIVSPSIPRDRKRRVSEESGVSAMSSAGDSKSFEELIRGDETIQYTLTPQNMRAIESPDSPLSLTAIPVPRSASGRAHSPSVSKHTGLHSHPLSVPLKSPCTAKPRDPRADQDSLGDFSDFIRSTGPAIPLKREEIHSRSSSSAASDIARPLITSNLHKGTNGTPRNVSGSIPRVGPVAALPARAASSAGRSGRRNKLQARDATVGKDSITDLIDFVRAGPDEVGGHRIPRTVAPFRSTMDSDQMSGFAGGKAIDASLPDARYSQASTHASTNHSSVTSQTGLLNSSNKANKPIPTGMNIDDDEDMMPKRKTRRVRDPYAIDFSDEEDDEFEHSSRPAPIQEESLADFLRNVPPPPSPKMTPIFAEAQKPPKKKPSFSSRFTRSGSTSQVQQHKTSNSMSSRTTSTKHTPSSSINPQFNASVGGSSHGNYSQQSEAPRATPSSNVIRKPYESREPVPVKFRSQTSDLADFLRSSEPPPSVEPKPFVHAKEESTFASRFFGRRKKSTAGF
ncbi:547f11a4-4c9e-47e6-9ab6-3600a355639f-CDS [Sclerotinia trifoliorum]|uniref:547f11a4-4c9e-47e6-9ab6-3600a355639f-CDS n=1 Tax=Sclerotinia trifoliorum TaxID=28548 RepID=A0A8H2W0A6_9HELO|nr:547f11a4-4c9e-47e6-9ab6-3600a355639f-CDS [Sclerotinia trifoliorum]